MFIILALVFELHPADLWIFLFSGNLSQNKKPQAQYEPKAEICQMI